jgi:hypothetical protein
MIIVIIIAYCHCAVFSNAIVISNPLSIRSFQFLIIIDFCSKNVFSCNYISNQSIDFSFANTTQSRLSDFRWLIFHYNNKFDVNFLVNFVRRSASFPYTCDRILGETFFYRLSDSDCSVLGNCIIFSLVFFCFFHLYIFHDGKGHNCISFTFFVFFLDT